MLRDFNDCAFDGSPSPMSERRHFQRQSGGLQAHLFPDLRDAQESDELEVVSLNLSRYGVGLELAQDVPVGSVYNIEIGAAHRRKGHAFRALQALEAMAVAAGATSIGLNVFAFNTGAQALYRKLGYATTNFNMRKRLAPPAED